ncbi:MAG: CHAP domain-containing protein [Eubacteriales bacterium]|nr:CHAP domain-containing protein [Eubacteriales bacterium]
MNKEELEILTNIIGAVESGGQIYGQRNYGAYAGAYANSPNEVTCTLGWAQNYGANAKKLVKAIFETDKAAFRKADTAGIEKKLSVDWVAAGWNPSAEEKKALIAIITTEAGKRCQDELFQEDMQKYIRQAEAFGVTDVAAQMMWCEIQHLGGLVPTQRIFGRAVKPYTPESIFASLMADQKDVSNNNQVGDETFQSRHECCVKWIRQYVQNADAEGEKTMGNITAQDALNVMRGWLGLSRSKGTHKPIIDTYNSHKPLARGYKASYQDDYCDITVSAVFIKLGAADLIGGTECGVEEHVKIFQRKGIWIEDGTITPKAGDIIVYNWDKASQPNDGYSDHIGFVESVSNGKITTIEGNTQGGIVARNVIPVGYGYIRGYARPKYAAGSAAASKPAETTAPAANLIGDCTVTLHTFLIGAQDNQIKAIQMILNRLGYKGKDGKALDVDGVLGTNSAYAVEQFQRAQGMKNISFGTVAAKTWSLLLNAK